MLGNNKPMVLEMIGIIAGFGVVAAILEIIFAKNVIYSMTGLLIGLLLAVYMLVYMNHIMVAAVDFDAKSMEKYVIKHSVIRYLSIVAVFGVVCVTDFADPIACFIGLMALKVAAYLQPLMQKIKAGMKQKKKE